MRGFSPHTQKAYLMRVTLFARYFNKHPDKLGEKEIREYFLHLVNEQARLLRGAHHDLLRAQVHLHDYPEAAVGGGEDTLHEEAGEDCP